jgi:hypothetical protein
LVTQSVQLRVNKMKIEPWVATLDVKRQSAGRGKLVGSFDQPASAVFSASANWKF